MNDGRVVAADLQFSVNAGNTLDESHLVRSNLLVLFCSL